MSETTTTKPALLPKPRTNVEYLTTFGYCPICDSPEVEGESFDTEDGRHVTQDVSCLRCMAGWTDVYRLQGYRSLEDRVGKAIQHDESFPQPLTLTARELAHVLAALRYTQRQGDGFLYDHGQDHFEDVAGGPLDGPEVDDLCERLNCGGDAPEPTPCETCSKRANSEGLTDEDKAALRQRAREEYANPSGDAIEIDDDAGFSLGGNGDGVWVQAWVWVQDES